MILMIKTFCVACVTMVSGKGSIADSLWTRKEGFFSDADVWTFCCKKLKIIWKLCKTVEKNVIQIRQLMTTIVAAGRLLLPF